jgi:glycosyltransferase involved in cell wall biosynthesis
LGNRVIYHRNPVNQGHAASVNAGVAKASGDWIKFLDDDDYLSPTCLEEIARAIAIHPQAVICSCVAAQVDNQDVELSRTPQFGPGLVYYIPQADIHYGMLLEIVPFGTPVQVACQREAFLKTGGWDSALDANCDDIDSWIGIAQFGDAIFLNQCLAYRTIWPGAFNQKISLSQRLATNILIKQKIYALVNEQHRSEIPDFENIKKYLKLHWYLVALKQRNLKSLLLMLDLSVLSPLAWRLLISAVLSRRSPVNNSPVRKLVLIES